MCFALSELSLLCLWQKNFYNFSDVNLSNIVLLEINVLVKTRLTFLNYVSDLNHLNFFSVENQTNA